MNEWVQRAGFAVRKRVKGPVRRMARRLNLEIVPASLTEVSALTALLNADDIDLVLDVGANQGQYGEMIRAAGFEGEIVSFEPSRDAFNYLARASSADAAWRAFNVAIGREAAMLELNLSSNSVSSSLLPVSDRHLRSAPGSTVVGQEKVEVRRLDSEVSIGSRSAFLKIDTQGYELAVLDGIGALTENIKYIQVEVSLVELYEGQASYLAVLQKLDELGYVPCLVFPGFVDPDRNFLLQFDIVSRRRAEGE